MFSAVFAPIHFLFVLKYPYSLLILNFLLTKKCSSFPRSIFFRFRFCSPFLATSVLVDDYLHARGKEKGRTAILCLYLGVCIIYNIHHKHGFFFSSYCSYNFFLFLRICSASMLLGFLFRFVPWRWRFPEGDSRFGEADILSSLPYDGPIWCTWMKMLPFLATL